MLTERIFIYCFAICIFCSGCVMEESSHRYEVIVLGGGTGGTAAAIQAARSGAKTLLVEPTPWLGGMLTSAGVSAIDGNHLLPSGIWGEFRDSLYAHYGSPDKLATGWVSHTQFEPAVGAQVFDRIVSNISSLEVWRNTQWAQINYQNGQWEINFTEDNHNDVKGAIIIDGTDLGDVIAEVGITYDLGMESRSTTQESVAPLEANAIIQDFTYVAILKDYHGPGDHLIKSPFPGYNPQDFYCACDSLCDNPLEDSHPCHTMLTYAKLPGEKYLINWPIHGNDFYANMVEMDHRQRDSVYQLAKEHTLNFVYYIQHELGMQHLGLAKDEFQTNDLLPYIPYHREARRIHGMSRFTLNHLENPYNYTLYRTGIASGDYPVDHHHRKNPQVPQLAFYPVPSFTVPLGALIPAQNLPVLVADKAISVSNIANGSTRLQPVVLQIGQAAGMVAAIATNNHLSPGSVSIRQIQDSLIKRNVFVQPFFDVPIDHPYFPEAQRIGCTGIIQGTGIPYQWANQTWFYPDRLMRMDSLFLTEYFPQFKPSQSGIHLSIQQAVNMVNALNSQKIIDLELVMEWFDKRPEDLLTRIEMAVLLDRTLDPFHQRAVNWDGKLK